jgi:NAD(P)-dependent dehydrogenase (short-subunit alcohol dehydrogenase family)
MAAMSASKAFIVTGPTSGIGRLAALELASSGTVVLVGRSPEKLKEVKAAIEQRGGDAVSVVCDLSDPASVQRAAGEIAASPYEFVGLLNNAGIMLTRDKKTAAGWDLTFATNFLGPFALTEALTPRLANRANVIFVASAIEDPERKPAKVMGMRGGRYISVEASARGEWQPGGCKLPGIDAYATSKQCGLAATFTLAREHPRLRFNAVEPGINPSTGLGGGNAFLRFVFGQIITRLPPFRRYRSTPQRAARVIARLMIDAASGGYFDENGRPMRGSALVHDPVFQDRVVAETRAFLAQNPDAVGRAGIL